MPSNLVPRLGTPPGVLRPVTKKGGAGFPLPPRVDTVTQNYDRIAGGTNVTITGDHFLPGATVLFGSAPATSIVWVSATSLTCNVPANAEDVYDITVTNPDNTSNTLADAFTYIAGHITSVSPSRGLSSGGQTVLIQGVNFVNGSTIKFGTVAATGVIFVDNTRFYCVTPANDDGYVDITITEPSTSLAIGRHAFGYTSTVFNEDIRRQPSIVINSTLNRGPNTARFVIDGSSIPPIGGEKVIFTDGETLVFAGQVQTVTQDIEDSRFNKAWTINAVDHTARFNRYRPFGVWNNVSATQVIKELVSKYAPGFATDFVQTGLPRISLVLNGEQDMLTIFSQIANALGEGHFYLDYRRSVHFYLLASLGAIDAAPNQALIVGPGSAMTVAASTTSTLGFNFKRGYYYFYASGYYAGSTGTGPNAKVYDALSGTGVNVMATRANASGVFLNYGQGGTPSQAPLPNQTTGAARWIMLSEQAANRNLQGDISNGVYCEGTLQPRGWTGVTADGVQIPSGAWPAAGPNAIYFASSDVWLDLETASGGASTPAVADFESALSPISNLIYLEGFLPQFANIPVFPAVGGRACTRRNIYAVRFGDLHVEGGTALTPWSYIGDNATTTSTPAPTTDGYFGITAVPTVAPPASPGVGPTAKESLSLNSALTYLNANCQPGYYSLVVTGVYQDGTESAGTVQTPPFLMGGTFQVDVANIPLFSPVNGVACIFRKIYAAIYQPYNPVVYGVPDFGLGSNLVWVIAENTSTGATFGLGSGLSGGVLTPSNAPPALKDVTGATQVVLGPDLETTDAPDDIDDNNEDLLLDPPFTSTSDDSQLRNRIYVKGKGSVVSVDAAIGDTTLKVADVGTYLTPSGRGRVIIGSRILSYTGLSVTSGAGAINLAVPLSQPVLQSNWLYGGGQPVLPFVQVDDLVSQAKQGSIETDDDGHATDGVHEYTIVDDSLTTYQQMYARGVAELKQFARPIVNVEFASRDPKLRPGKTVHIDLTDPPITGDFIIQEVTIDQFHDESDDLTPRYRVKADSAARFTFIDFMNALADGAKVDSNAAGSAAGIVQTSAVQATSLSIVAGRPLDIFRTTYGYAAYNATNGSFGLVSGVIAPSYNGTLSTINDTRGTWRRGSTTNVVGNSTGPAYTGTFIRVEQKCRFRVYCRFPTVSGSTINDIRLHMGFYPSVTPTNLNDPPNNSIGWRFCPQAGDQGPVMVSKIGTAATVVGQSVSPSVQLALDTEYCFDLVSDGTYVYLYVNVAGDFTTKSTAQILIPAALVGTDLFPVFFMFTNASTIKTMDTLHCGWENGLPL